MKPGWQKDGLAASTGGFKRPQIVAALVPGTPGAHDQFPCLGLEGFQNPFDRLLMEYGVKLGHLTMGPLVPNWAPLEGGFDKRGVCAFLSQWGLGNPPRSFLQGFVPRGGLESVVK